MKNLAKISKLGVSQYTISKLYSDNYLKEKADIFGTTSSRICAEIGF
jgi:hypothetical protein